MYKRGDPPQGKKVTKKQAARLVAKRLSERRLLKNSTKAGRKRNHVPDIA